MNFDRLAVRIAPRGWAAGSAVGLLALLAWSAADWTWVLLARSGAVPQPATIERADNSAATKAIAARRLFGGTDDGSAGLTSLNLKLHGVFAIRGRLTPVAIIEVSGSGERAVAVGDDVVAGVTLESVHPDYVLLRRQGALERLELEKAK